MSESEPCGKTFEIATFADLFDVPSDRREACFRQIQLFMLTNELLFGDKAKEVIKGIAWTDDGDNSVDVNVGEGNHFVLKVTKADTPKAQGVAR